MVGIIPCGCIKVSDLKKKTKKKNCNNDFACLYAYMASFMGIGKAKTNTIEFLELHLIHKFIKF